MVPEEKLLSFHAKYCLFSEGKFSKSTSYRYREALDSRLHSLWRKANAFLLITLANLQFELSWYNQITLLPPSDTAPQFL